MTTTLETIQLVALDIDGVALADTFSPIIHALVTKHEKAYTRELERNVFSQPRHIAARVLIDALGLSCSIDEMLRIYFAEREGYLREHGCPRARGLGDFLQTARDAGLKVVAYGGLARGHFDEHLGDLAHFFDGEKYICTNDFRPGIREIVTQFYRYEYRQVLVIDDVSRVAEAARALGAPFVGVPSSFKSGFQRQDMVRVGVKYIVNHIGQIDGPLLAQVDRDAREGSAWIG